MFNSNLIPQYLLKLDIKCYSIPRKLFIFQNQNDICYLIRENGKKIFIKPCLLNSKRAFK